MNNFESLLTASTSYGAKYNPSKNSLALPAMQQLLADSKESLDAHKQSISVYNRLTKVELEVLKADGKEVKQKSSSQMGFDNRRDTVLYKPLTGMVDLALDAKMYMKSVTGNGSVSYKPNYKFN